MAVGCFLVPIIVWGLYNPWPGEERCTIIKTSELEMLPIGNCYDNAAMESFFATVETELIRARPFDTREQARLALFDYIEVFYNRQRLHSSLGYRSPVDYEAQLMVENATPHVSEKSGQDHSISHVVVGRVVPSAQQNDSTDGCAMSEEPRGTHGAGYLHSAYQ